MLSIFSDVFSHATRRAPSQRWDAPEYWRLPDIRRGDAPLTSREERAEQRRLGGQARKSAGLD